MESDKAKLFRLLREISVAYRENHARHLFAAGLAFVRCVSDAQVEELCEFAAEVTRDRDTARTVREESETVELGMPGDHE